MIRKLGIIGGSGLYKMEGFKKTKWKKIKTSWGKPSDEILTAKLGKEEICFIPRHSRGHKINPTNINYRANIDDKVSIHIPSKKCHLFDQKTGDRLGK